MIKRFLVAGAAAAGLLVASAMTLPASAAPLAQPGLDKAADVTLVKRGGGGGHGVHGGGGGFHAFHKGGGPRIGGFHHGGGRPHIGRPHGGPRVYHRHHGPRIRFYPGFYGYAPYYYGYNYFLDDDDDGCEWLRLKALDTGSSYWWRRYRRCMGY